MLESETKQQTLLKVLERTRRQAERLVNDGVRKLGITEDDLFSEGQLAAIKAMETHEELGCKSDIFSYTATATKRAMIKVIVRERERKVKQKSLVQKGRDGEEFTPYHDSKADDPAETVKAKEMFSLVPTNGTKSKPKGQVVTLTQVRAGLPTAYQTALAAEELMSAAVGSVSKDDVESIMKTMVKKARGGHVTAARFVFQQIRGGQSIRICDTIAEDPR